MKLGSVINYAPYILFIAFAVNMSLLLFSSVQHKHVSDEQYRKANSILNEVWFLRLEFDDLEKSIVTYEQFKSQDRYDSLASQYEFIKKGVDNLIQKRSLFDLDVQEKILSLKTPSDFVHKILMPGIPYTDFTVDRRFQKAIHDLNRDQKSLIFTLVENENFLKPPHNHFTFTVLANISAFGATTCVLLLCVYVFYREREQKQIQNDLDKIKSISETQQSAMAASADGVGIVDENGKLIYANTALTNLCGLYNRNFSNFLNDDWEMIFDDEMQNFVRTTIYPDMGSKGTVSHDVDLAGHDNEILHANLTLTRLAGGGLVVSLRNTTEQIRAEAENKKLQSQFFHAQKMEAIGRLAGGIAHDFNNILAAIAGNAEFLHEDLESQPKILKYAENILNATSQAKTLVDYMLAFSRQKPSDMETVDLRAPVMEVMSMLDATLPKKIELEQTIAHDALFIDANSTQISQVLMNLCVNAKDAMNGKGGLSVSLVRERAANVDYGEMLREELPEEGDVPFMHIEDISSTQVRMYLGTIKRSAHYAVLKVSDTGSGMSRTVMENIFDPFFTTKPVDKGTGLGLSTVHGVIVSHRAAMVVDSTLGEGTTFTLFFPIVDEVQKLDFDPVELIIVPEEDFIPAHILLVEDQDDVRMMTESMLERLGYDVTSCASGIEAMDILKEQHDNIDLAITDQNMPKMNGLELIMQCSYDFPDIPFMLVSGYSLQKMEKMIEDQPNVKDVLRKPVSKSMFGLKISNVLKALEEELDEDAA